MVQASPLSGKSKLTLRIGDPVLFSRVSKANPDSVTAFSGFLHWTGFYSEPNKQNKQVLALWWVLNIFQRFPFKTIRGRLEDVNFMNPGRLKPRKRNLKNCAETFNNSLKWSGVFLRVPLVGRIELNQKESYHFGWCPKRDTPTWIAVGMD